MEIVGYNGTNRIVEMTEDEFTALKKFLYERNVSSGDVEVREFEKDFEYHLAEMVKHYGLHRQTRGALVRTFQSPKYRDAARHSFYNDDGSLMTFAQWRANVLWMAERYRQYPDEILKFHRVARRGVMHLAEVLSKYNPE